MKDDIAKRISKNETKKRNTQGDLDDITTGKKTFKTLLKTTNDTKKVIEHNYVLI